MLARSFKGSAKARPTILVVDDDRRVRRLASAAIERAGWRVLEAEAGASMHELVRRSLENDSSQALDALVMDMALPGVGGLACLRRLRDEAGSALVPVLMLGDEYNPADMDAAFDAGCDGFLTKPLCDVSLIATLRTLLKLRDVRLDLDASAAKRADLTRALLALSDLTNQLSVCSTLDEVLGRVLVAAADLTQSRRAAIILPNQKQDGLRVAMTLRDEDGAAKGDAVSADGTIAAVFSEREPRLLNPEDRTDRSQGGELWPAHLGCACIPLTATGSGPDEPCVGVICLGEHHGNAPYEEIDLEYFNLFRSFAADTIQGVLTRQSHDQARDMLIVALVGLTESRDNDTGRHIDRVTTFSIVLAEALRGLPGFGQIDDAFIEELRRTAPLHDIGKVAIPDRILLKPGRLTAEEFEIMKTHSLIGADTIRSVRARAPRAGFMEMAEQIARHHHEWFDGNGYPDGLSGNDIPLAARVVAVADVYDALTTRRVYKNAVSHEAATDVILGLNGRQFDPRVIEAFQANLELFAQHARELNDESVAAASDIGPTAPGVRDRPPPARAFLAES